MPKRKVISRISGLVESDDDDVMGLGANKVASQEESLDERPAKKPRGRPKSSAHPKSDDSNPSSTRQRSSSAGTVKQDSAPKKRSGRGRPRTATAEPEPEAQEYIEQKEPKLSVTNQPHPEVSGDELDSAAENALPKKRGPRGRKPAQKTKQVTADGEFEYTPTGSRHLRADDSVANPPKRLVGRQRKTDQEDTAVVPDSQTAIPEVDESALPPDEPVHARATSLSPLKPRVNGQTVQRPLQDAGRKRATVSFADSDKTASDPDLRRKLGDMTKKYEGLETKFRNLREIGIVEANANFEKLRKQCEAATTASNELIASLKKELTAQTALGQQSRSLQKKLRDRETEVTGLQTKADDLSSQLSTAHTEIRALQSKLAAARNATVSTESVGAKGPGSAVKGSANRIAAAGAADAAQMAQLAQLKEDLYSDLTGLIIRGVKKREADYLYDCIQTGTNGTLHFKLAVAHDGNGKTVANFDSAEFHYMPLLDANRDRDLMDLLPEYLTVDITFSRQNASKFYTRVIDTLTKRRIDPDD